MLESDLVKENKAVPSLDSLADIAADSWNDMRLLISKPTNTAGQIEHFAYNDESDDLDPDVQRMTPYQQREYRRMPTNEQHDYRNLDQREKEEYLRKGDDDKYEYLRKTPNERWDEDHAR
jgi:hypothetical protein